MLFKPDRHISLWRNVLQENAATCMSDACTVNIRSPDGLALWQASASGRMPQLHRKRRRMMEEEEIWEEEDMSGRDYITGEE